MDAAAALRGKDVLNAQDKTLLRQWITDHVAALQAAAKANDLKKLAMTKRNMVEAASKDGASPATPGFRVTYADLCAAVFQPYLGIRTGAKVDPRVSLYLAQVLASVRQVSSLDTLLAALNSQYAGVRLCAAKAIRDMRNDIVATQAKQVNSIINTLQQAGAKEGDPATAQMLYEAVDFRSQAPTSTEQVIDAMIEMLKGREQLYSNDLVSSFYPDAYAMNVLQDVNLPEAAKRKAVPVVLGILEGAADRWVSVAREDEGVPVEAENPYDAASVRDWHLRYQLAYVTQEAESLLAKLGTVPGSAHVPDMAKLMSNLSTAEQVNAAADTWAQLMQPKAAATAPGADSGFPCLVKAGVDSISICHRWRSW